MKTKFLTRLVYESVLGTNLIILVEPLRYYSEILKRIVEIPTGFVCDLESIPMIRGTSPRGGVAHDYFCRVDSDPVVTKQKAASLYLEAQACKDEYLKMKNPGWLNTFGRFIRRHFKTAVVRVWPGYFHKHSVMDGIETFCRCAPEGINKPSGV